jgi:hypothetical protein
MYSFPTCTKKEELELYLLTQNNPYVAFICEQLTQQTFFINNFLEDTELHHIIPLHANGPDVEWNLIRLSVGNHQRAHELLYNVYQKKEDLCCLRFRQKSNRKAYRLRIQLSHASQRLNGNGFFNSKTQRINGAKGGKVKSEQKRLTYRDKIGDNWKRVLNSKSTWLYKKTNFIMEIPAYECFLPQDVAYKLLTYKPFSIIYTAKPQSFTSCLARVVNKTRKSASGWLLLEIN